MPPKTGDPRPRRRTSNKGMTLLTPEVHEAFMRNLRTGVPIPVAAKAAGIAEGTVKQWLLTGRKAAAKRDAGETLSAYEEACNGLTVEAGKVYEEVHLLLAGRVVEASRDDWRAATWMLQRRHPETWNLPERVELTGAGGGPIEVAEIERRALEFIEAIPDEDLSGNGHRALG